MENNTFYENLQRLCKLNGISITTLTQELGLSSSNVSGWKSGAQPQSKTLKKIAEYFHVTVDQLINGEAATIHDNHGIIGSTNAPVTIINGSEHVLNDQETELLSIFQKLSVIDRARLMVYASELLK